MVKTVTNETDFTLKKISSHLKDEHQLHTLRGEVIPTKRTLPNSKEVIHFIPELFIPELKIPIEITADKQRDDDYMKIGMLPMVIVPESLRVSVEKYIDTFMDFHKKWKGKKI
tara:strand:- start:151 stop:489 length:339 start_codon:yes stop_codon:yes gene_type:complete